jgi:acyl carrier protein
LITGLVNVRLDADLAGEQLIFADVPPWRVSDLRQAMRQQRGPCIDPETLVSVAEEAGYDTLLRWAGAGPNGLIDAALISRSTATGKPFWPIPVPAQAKPWRLYANNPLQSRIESDLITAVRDDLKASVPDYLLPYAFVVLEQLPLTANGKLDVRALPIPAPSGLVSGRERLPVGPRGPVEEVVADIWGTVLGLAPGHIGADSNFFDLGGHSLLLIRIVSRLKSTFQVEFPVQKMFENPTVAGVANALTFLEPRPGHAVAAAKLRLRLMRMSSGEIEALTRTRKQIAKG